VVFGMPKEAIAAGAVEAVLPIGKIAEHMQERLSQQLAAGGVAHRI
jgi:chemotaxis response regulator CheB